MPSKIAHATAFTLVKRQIPRPVEVIRLLAKGGLPLNIARSVLERLATTDIKGRYFHETDSVYIEIAPGPSAAVRAVANGLNVDLDADDNIIGFDIDNASRLGAVLRDFIASGAMVEDLARAWHRWTTHETKSTRRKAQVRRKPPAGIIWAISLRPRKSCGERQSVRESAALFRQALRPTPDGLRAVGVLC